MFLPKKIKWFSNILSKEGFGIYSSGKVRKMRKSIQNIRESDYYYIIEKVDEEFLDKFEPVYKEFIASIGGLEKDIRKRILEDDIDIDFYAVSLYSPVSKLTGSLVFSVEDGCYTNNYKCFPGKLEDVRMPQSPSNVAEYLFIEHANNQNIKKVSWGTDRNYYGYGASLGLAKHKLEIGGLPYMSSGVVENTDFEWKKDKDVLTFLFDSKEDRSIAKKAVLHLTSKNLEEKKKRYNKVIDNLNFETEVVTN